MLDLWLLHAFHIGRIPLVGAPTANVQRYRPPLTFHIPISTRVLIFYGSGADHRFGSNRDLLVRFTSYPLDLQATL